LGSKAFFVKGGIRLGSEDKIPVHGADAPVPDTTQTDLSSLPIQQDGARLIMAHPKLQCVERTFDAFGEGLTENATLVSRFYPSFDRITAVGACMRRKTDFMHVKRLLLRHSGQGRFGKQRGDPDVLAVGVQGPEKYI
jgi:hypothetical protein